MHSKLLDSRYDFTAGGKAIIDISVDEISDLFNSFDMKSSFVKRELDQDFVDYVVDSVKELDDHDFIIRITINREYNMIQESNLRKAITNYFSYLHEVEKQKLKAEMYKCIALFILGALLMAAANIHQIPAAEAANAEMWRKLLLDGVEIAGWVAFWEAFMSLIFGWNPFYFKRGIYDRIVQAELQLTNSVRKIEL